MRVLFKLIGFLVDLLHESRIFDPEVLLWVWEPAIDSHDV
jgi:hypothetical protein